MSNNPFDALLEKLDVNDRVTTEQLVDAYEPFLRRIVRRHLSPRLRSTVDSMDIVQSAWLHVLQGVQKADWQFADEDWLRAFLIKVIRNRVIDHERRAKAARDRERIAGLARRRQTENQTRPSEWAQETELWDQMLSLCPPQHREILRLKRQGLLLAEIADRTKLHPSSVRRILYEVARQLTMRQLDKDVHPATTTPTA